MDFSIIIILRIIHVFSAIIWVGSTIFMWLFITPTVRQMGPDGGKFMQAFLLQSRYSMVIGLVNALTVLSGALLYFHTSGNFSADWMRSAQGVVLSIGVVAGLLAAAQGFVIIFPIVNKIKALMREINTSEGPPSQEQMTRMQGFQAGMARNTNIILILMLISLLGMESFRYIG